MTSVPTGGVAATGISEDSQPIRVLFCCDPGFYQHLAVALASLLENNRRHPLDIAIVVSAQNTAAERKLLSILPEHPDAKVAIRHFDLDSFRDLPTSAHITAEAYLRILAIDTLPPGTERIIYLDCDLVVVAALDSLWETDISNHALAAVPDPFVVGRPQALSLPDGVDYVNSGVLLINVRRWREQGLAARIITYAEQEGSRLTLHDQDAINAVLHAEILSLPLRWNCQARMFQPNRSLPEQQRAAMATAARDPAIIHFTTAQKPWMFTAMVPRRSEYHRYLALTAWRGAPLTRRSLAHLPEAFYYRFAYAVGSSYSYELFLSSTNVGRVLVRSGQLLQCSISLLAFSAIFAARQVQAVLRGFRASRPVSSAHQSQKDAR